MANIKMPFGKYRGKRLTVVPTEYLIWLRDEYEGLSEELRRAVEYELTKRDDVPTPSAEPAPPKEEEAQPAAEEEAPAVRNLSPVGQSLVGTIRMIYRNLALKYHPDRGGSRDAMQALNEMHEQVQSLIARTFSA